MLRILRALDRHRFLGFPIWEFSFRSLPRLYGHLFLRDIVLRHPVRTLKGILAYRRFSRPGRWEEEILHLHPGTEADLREEILPANGGGLLVALGFCQKPVGGPGVGCPAGRFSHECHVLTRADFLEVQIERLPLSCRNCDIRLIGAAALPAGAAVYIMTSAADIARHLFIPALDGGGFRHALFLQCSYSIPAMVLPLLICRLQAVLIGYSEGDCRDYPQFLSADKGTKPERARLNPTAHTYLFDLLREVASARGEGGQHSHCFNRKGFVYIPSAEA
jgi:hypothetical protein